MLNDLVKSRIDDKKPRRGGLTYIVDKLQGVDKDNFEILSSMVDVVKIYGAFPLLIPETILHRKIKFYHDFNILVSTGSTITEYSIMENSFDRFAAEAAKIGFDIIEIGENNITYIIQSKNLEYHWKIGAKIDEAMKIADNKVILEDPKILLMDEPFAIS